VKVIAQGARASEWEEPGLKSSDYASGQRTGVLGDVCKFTGSLSLESQWLKRAASN